MKNLQELITHLENFVTEARKIRLKEVLSNRTKHFTVVVEDVYHSHNASAIVRSCDVFGVQETHFIEVRNKKNLNKNIALGAEKWVGLNTYDNSIDCIDYLKNQNYQIVSTTPHSGSCVLTDFDISVPSAFVFGAEKEGLSQEIMNITDISLKIPMVGFTESLNISVAAAIILQNTLSLLRKSDINWKLCPKEAGLIYLNWLKKSIKDSDNIIARFEANDN